MVWTSEAGINQQEVDRSAGAANEHFAGIAFSDSRRVTDFVEVVQKTIPHVGPFTIQLQKTTPVAGTMYIVNSLGTAFTDDLAPGAPVLNHYNVSAGGLITFNAGNADQIITIRFTYLPTLVELNSRFPGPAKVHEGQTLLKQVAVAVGYCEVYTTQYESNRAYTLQCRLYTGAAGKFTTDATAVAVAGRCISLPSVGDPFLGVAYSVGTAHTW